MLKITNMRMLTKCNIPKLSPYILQRTTTTDSNLKAEKTDFQLIYKLPYIRHATVLNKLKIIQGGLTLVSIPTVVALQQMDVVSLEYVYVVSSIGITGTIVLSLFGVLATNLIGLIHLNSDKTIVKVAYLDFWAKRQNVEIPVDDIVPGSEVRPNYLFNYLERYSKKQSLKFIKNHGIYVNKEDFDYAFGIL